MFNPELFRIKHNVLATKCTCACGDMHSDASRFFVIMDQAVCITYNIYSRFLLTLLHLRIDLNNANIILDDANKVLSLRIGTRPGACMSECVSEVKIESDSS